ncbi:LamG domain-containing protein [Litchfieldia alkalitelluris]|uniref:LamG-like jellyroll fold domain-containing protein n=1 Tax=Litchfieldia alkalitelluris TaxID=304268 RepID=UPI000995E44C|nr:LamG-like jellyroll fold domain-containing protein [Litchfieldia alkalitelluris]
MAYNVQLDGVDDYAVVAGDSHIGLDLTNHFKISITFSPSDLSSSQKYLLSKAVDGGDAYSIIWEYTDNKVEFYSFKYTGDNPRTGSAITITDTNKHTISYEYDGAIFRGYLDGVEQFSLAKSFSLIATGGSTRPLYIARSSGSNYFKGNLYDTTILKNNVVVAEWLMDEGTGATLYDTSGNGNHATLYGGTWVDDGTGGTTTTHEGTATLNGLGTVTVSGNRETFANGSLLGQGSLTATIQRIVSGDVSLLGSGTLTADSSSNAVHLAEAILSGLGTLNTSGQRVTLANATFNGEGTLNAIAGNVTVITGEANLTGVSSIVAEGLRVVSGYSTMNGSGSITAEVTKEITGNASLFGQGTLTANPSMIYIVDAELIGTSTFEAIPGEKIELIGTMRLEGQQVLNVYLVGKQELNVNLKGLIH